MRKSNLHGQDMLRYTTEGYRNGPAVFQTDAVVVPEQNASLKAPGQRSTLILGLREAMKNLIIRIVGADSASE